MELHHDTVLPIITAPRRDSRHWKSGTITWGEIVDWLRTPATHKACGNYVLGTFSETTVRHDSKSDPCTNLHRTKLAVVSRAVITLDADTPGEGFVEAVDATGYAGLIHTTYSSTNVQPRYRVLIPTDRSLAPDEYHAAASALIQKIGKEHFDPGSVQPERYMFKPSEPKPGTFWGRPLKGTITAPAEQLLDDFNPDLTILPMPKPHRNKRDPFAIAGTIGAFNRAYEDFNDLISEYELPYESVAEDRWRLAGAVAAAGMGTMGEGLVYSHHANDPAFGQASSAFDLARLHLYGDLDDGHEKTPVNRKPSQLAMLETATQDIRVVKELVGEDFVADLEQTTRDVLDDAPVRNWRLDFKLDPRSGEIRDVIDNWDLIGENDPSFRGLYYNEMTLSVETDQNLPWRQDVDKRPTFDSGDRASLALHIERQYTLRPARYYLDDLINDRARRRRVNPVRDYLEGLVWDGVARVETALPGVTPTDYTRMVARKCLAAAVSRVLDPGCKWDHMLILYGTEGLGKSHWVDKLARGWSAPLGRIGDKDTLIAMQRAWIMTSDEGHSLKKADFDVQKEFITRTADLFRMPYEREAQLVPRHCVIWGTTNDSVFLRNQEGNRRFLIVQSEGRVDFDSLTDEYVDQVWAEATALYLAGEQLWLDDDESVQASAERERFTEEDALAGQIGEFLDMKVPDDWMEKTPFDRREYFMNRGDGDFGATGDNRMDVVCSAQIWTECLGRNYGDHRRVDLLEINNSLGQVPGWVKMHTQEYVPGYGKQTVYRRLEEAMEML